MVALIQIFHPISGRHQYLGIMSHYFHIIIVKESFRTIPNKFKG